MHELILRTPTVQIAACRWGDASARPVLALHGWLDNAASFQPVAAFLQDIQLVALDLPGHGCSGHYPAGMFYHFIDYLPVVLAAADDLGWKRFSLLGHSLGAGIASYIAAAMPERIERLALIDGLGPAAESEQDGPSRLRKSLMAQRRLDDKRVPVYADIQAAANARHKATGLQLAAAELLARRACKAVDGGFSWRSDPRLTVPSPAYSSEAQVQAMLSAIQAPSLFIRALNGLLIKRPHITARCDCIQQLQVIDVPGGHHLHMENPQAVSAILQEFFTQS